MLHDTTPPAMRADRLVHAPAILLALLLGAWVPAHAADQAYSDPVPYDMLPGAYLARAEARQDAALTRHTLVLGGRRLRYTATAGHLLVRRPGAPARVEAAVYYVAYTLDGKDPARRPITFFWNGGPGCSSVYLDLGGWGPRTLDIDEARLPMAALARSPRFRLRANPQTLLGDTDMVFVDAIGTGWSEAVAPYRNRDFEGVDADARLMRDFVIDYLRDNGRAMSPKYLYGESYAGIRTPIVARLLEQYGPLAHGAPVLDGVIMNSPIMDYKTNCYMRWYVEKNPSVRLPDGDIAYTRPPVSCEGFVPTYMMVHYAQEHPDASLAQDRLAARDAIALTRDSWKPELRAYRATLAGLAARPPYVLEDFPAAQQRVFRSMGAATGIGASAWARDFDMNVPDFDSALLGLGAAQWDVAWSRVDRYDAMVRLPPRLSGYVTPDGHWERWVTGADYLNASVLRAQQRFTSDFLQYRDPSPYVVSRWPRHWNWHHGSDHSNHPQSVSDLYEAIALNPGLRVLITHGEQDTAAPFYQTMRDLRVAGLAGKVPVSLYPGGHMVYLTRPSHAWLKASLDRFYAQGRAR
jgi:carboxypeptidase C (cathepsin A)